jgi:hypothetical protein
MKNFLFSSMALAAVLFVPGVASADDVSDRTAAIQLCRTEIAAQARLDTDAVRLDQVRVRPRTVRADFDIWRHGQLQNVRCEVRRAGAELSVATITPTLETASAESAGTASAAQ